jgi:hypothetical protein
MLCDGVPSLASMLVFIYKYAWSRNLMKNIE